MTKKKATYIPPEIMPIAWCSAVLNIVLEKNEKAGEIYEDIIDCFDSTGIQEITFLADEVLPDKQTLLKEILEKSGFDIKKPPDKKSFGIPYVRGLYKGGQGDAD